MAKHNKSADQKKAINTIAMPDDIRMLLEKINRARRFASLYGLDHPSSKDIVAELTDSFESFTKGTERITCVFAKGFLIVNESAYTATDDSEELFRVLQSRSVMAVTFIYPIPVRDIHEFILFLITETADILRSNGAASYLRKRGMSHIIVTEAVYTTDGGFDEEADFERVKDNPPNYVDHSISAAIDWLRRQEGEEGSPKLHINEILSEPESAAKLIREAVTKLHVSRKGYTKKELSTEVIHNLKELSEGDQKAWDESTPHIRKAMSKLPKEMVPSILGISNREEPTEDLDKALDFEDIEFKISETLSNSIDRTKNLDQLDIDALRVFFETKRGGLLSEWKKELQPSSIMESCARTYETLMAWEDNPEEHARVAKAQAHLITRAMEIRNFDTAWLVSMNLVREAQRNYGKTWHSANAVAALQSIDLDMLEMLVESALKGGDYHQKEISANLVEVLPNLAIMFIGRLGAYNDEMFGVSLERGVEKAGLAALPGLVHVLRTGKTQARLSSVKALISIGNIQAFTEVADSIRSAEPSFVLSILEMLKESGSIYGKQTCATTLEHPSSEVRVYALRILAEIGDPGIVPPVLDIANGGFRSSGADERVEAIKVVGKFGGDNEIEPLRRLVNKRTLIGGRQYEKIREAAKQALREIGARKGSAAA